MHERAGAARFHFQIHFFIAVDLKAFEKAVLRGEGPLLDFHALIKEMCETMQRFIIRVRDLSLILPLIVCA